MTTAERAIRMTQIHAEVAKHLTETDKDIVWNYVWDVLAAIHETGGDWR